MSSFWPQFEDFSPQSPGVRASVMLRWLIATAPVVALASTPCVKDAVLTQDPMLPAPAIYVQSWTACQKKCEEGPLCHSFSFKGDSVPVGACWLFPATASLKEVADVKAYSGPKVCEAAVVKEAPDAVPPASGAASSGKAGLRGYGIPAAAAHSYGVANAGHDVPGAVFQSGEGGKTLVATPSNSSATNLAIAGGVGAAVVAAGAFFMLPGKKKKTKRGLKREEEDQVEVPTIASSAPLVEPPQLVYPGTSQAIPGASVAMAYAPQMLQPLQPMAMAQSYAGLPQGGEYMMYEPVTAMQQQYVYDQGQMMAYQPVQAQ